MLFTGLGLGRAAGGFALGAAGRTCVARPVLTCAPACPAAKAATAVKIIREFARIALDRPNSFILNEYPTSRSIHTLLSQQPPDAGPQQSPHNGTRFVAN